MARDLGAECRLGYEPRRPCRLRRDRRIALRTYLATPDLQLRLVRLPAYSPDFNADEAIWDWVRDEVTANTCLGSKDKVREKVGQFFRGLAERTAEVKQRCRTILQARAEAFSQTVHVDPTLALVW